jgi:hypothetical protein
MIPGQDISLSALMSGLRHSSNILIEGHFSAHGMPDRPCVASFACGPLSAFMTPARDSGPLRDASWGTGVLFRPVVLEPPSPGMALRRCRRSHLLAVLVGVCAIAPAPAQPTAAEFESYRARIDAAVRAVGDHPRLRALSPKKPEELAEFVSGNLLFTLLHELGACGDQPVRFTSPRKGGRCHRFGRRHSIDKDRVRVLRSGGRQRSASVVSD